MRHVPNAGIATVTDLQTAMTTGPPAVPETAVVSAADGPERGRVPDYEAAAEAGLTYDRTVPRHLVHRSSLSEVLLTSWCRTGTDTFALGAQWPRRHSFYGPSRHGTQDPLLMAETLRQTAIFLAHTGYGVARGDAFVMKSLAYRTAPDLLPAGHRLCELRVEAVCADVRRTADGRLRSLRITIRAVTAAGEELGSGVGELVVLAPEAYKRLRGDVPPMPDIAPLPAPVPAALVGRTDPGDVVLGAGTGPRDWLLRADTTHPVLFDHPLDHVPGMLVLEAARQAAAAVMPVPSLAVAMHVRLSRFLELAHPCEVTAGLLVDGRVEVRFQQSGNEAAVVEVQVAPDPSVAAVEMHVPEPSAVASGIFPPDPALAAAS